MNNKKILKRTGITLLVLLIIFFLTVDSVDYSKYKDKPYYLKSMESISNQLDVKSSGSLLEAGWSKKSIVPEEPVRLTGPRFQPFDSVMDTVYVRAFVFEDTEQLYFFLTYDLWIMHPNFTGQMEESIRSAYPETAGVYFTATHTHSSIGGWASGALGSLVIGGNNQNTVDYLKNQTLKAIEDALDNSASIKHHAFSKEWVPGKVVNRLNRKDGPVDEYLRKFTISRTDSASASIFTFSAHPVYLSKDENYVSGDYPGALTRLYEQKNPTQFPAFASGAMGSHTPVVTNKDNSYAAMINYGHSLDNPRTRKEFLSFSKPDISFSSIPIQLPSAQFRISKSLRLRPWIFNLILDPEEATITVLKMGDCLFVGLPIEISGEFYPELEAIARSKRLNLMITSFNGTYLGYAPRGHYYNKVSKAETRTMNWYGPNSGEYFFDLIVRIIEAS